MKINPEIEKIIKGKGKNSVRMHTGYLGKGNEKTTLRLYLEMDLSKYIEFDKSTVIHSIETETKNEFQFVTTVWLEKNADINVVSSIDNNLNNLFEGEIFDGTKETNLTLNPFQYTEQLQQYAAGATFIIRCKRSKGTTKKCSLCSCARGELREDIGSF